MTRPHLYGACSILVFVVACGGDDSESQGATRASGGSTSGGTGGGSTGGNAGNTGGSAGSIAGGAAGSGAAGTNSGGTGAGGVSGSSGTGAACPSPLPSSWIFCDDFETQDPACWSPGGSETSCGGFAIVSGVVALATGQQHHSGNNAVRLTYAANEEFGGGSVKFAALDHVFTRYYEYWAPDFDFGCGLKVHRLSGYNEAAGLNYFDIIGVVYGNGSGGGQNFCGVNEPGFWSTGYNGGPHDWGDVGGSASVVRGKWFCWEHEIKLNQPGASDGEVRSWVDGAPVVDKTGVNIRASLTVGVNRVLFGGWYSNGCSGGNPCVDPEKPSVRYLDDVVIAKERIGCQ